MGGKWLLLMSVSLSVVFLVGTIHLMNGLRCLDIKLDRVEKVLEKERRLSRIEKSSETSNITQVEKAMLKRSAHIRAVCQDMRGNKERDDCGLKYESKEFSFSQYLKKQFLFDHKTGTTYCFIHKVASSSWMALFARLENNPSFLSWVSQTGSYYTVKARMSSSTNIVAHNTAQTDLFSFMVVRNPFDRILSAYRDRILRGDSNQALQHVPLILTNHTSEDIIKDGKVIVFPTFDAFVGYLIEGAIDPHWEAFYSACAPCLIDYDAIVKLENAPPEENYVLEKSGMGQFVEMERKHSSSQGSSEKRKQFYSALSCERIQKLYHIYRMDFILFQYSVQHFLQSISKNCPDLKV